MIVGETKPRGSKTLPLHISDDGSLYIVRVRRGPMTFRASVAKSSSDALNHALRLRDQFLIASGPALYKNQRWPSHARSNTGLVGISETVKWTQYRPRYCFAVSTAWTHPTMKRVYFGPHSRTRAEALRMARGYRARMKATVAHA